MLKKDGIVLAKLDGTKEEELLQRFAVRGFPTLFFFKKGVPKAYNGPRTADGIVAWVREKSGPAVITISTAEQLKEFKNENKRNAIGHFEEGSDSYTAFFATAENPKLEDFKFAIITDKSIANIETGQFQLNRDFVDQPLIFDKEVTFESIGQFILAQGNGYPYFEHAQTSWGRLVEIVNLIGLVIFDNKNEETLQAQTDLFTSLAKEFAGQAAFAYVGIEYVKKAAELGVTGNRVPTLVIVGINWLNFPYPDSDPYDKESISTWLKGIMSGEVKAHFKSEPVPEENDGPVKIVVGSNFDEIVLNNKKDVLLEFYAPWCGHCKHLAPIYEQVGEYFQNVENVVVAKIDATANDNTVSIRVQGFPTIYLFPGDDKSQPIEYSGERTVEALVQFISENGSHGEEEKGDDHGHAHDHHGHKHEEL